MITFQLRDFRGCVHADIICAPIALVGGRNGQGKTSIAQGIGAVLTGQAMPVAGLPRGTGGMLVRTGAMTASVVVEGESGSARIEWPAGHAASNGEPPAASAYAAGLASVATLPSQERVRVLSEYLKSDPTREDLRAALEQTPGLATAVDVLWTLIQDKGWDGAHAIRRERGAELKGRWRQVTGVNYGSRVAASWRPDLADEQLSEAELIGLVEEADRQRNRALAAAAVTGAERERLTAEATTIDRVAQQVTGAEQEVDRLRREIAETRERRAKLPSGNQPTPMPCPHCGGPLVLRRINLAETHLEAAGDPIPESELKRARMAIAELDGSLDRLTGEVRGAEQTLQRTRLALASATAARDSLEQMAPAREDAPDIEAARAALTRAEKRLASYRQKREADDIQARIAGNDIALDLLAPDGLRAKRLGEVLQVFNETVLAELSSSAGWQPVSVAPDMSLAYGGRPYALCATSEQYRVRGVLQLAMARLDNSAMVVIDAADVLDAPTRSGLFTMLQTAAVPAVVCLTLSRREQLPDLASMGLGQSYWMDSGTAEALSAAPQGVAA